MNKVETWKDVIMRLQRDTQSKNTKLTTSSKVQDGVEYRTNAKHVLRILLSCDLDFEYKAFAHESGSGLLCR